MGAPWRAALGLVVVSLACAVATRAADDKLLSVRIDLDKPAFFRGCTDPVLDLKVRMTVTNGSDKISLVIPRPQMDPLGVVDFEIDLLGAPTGVPRREGTPERTRIRRKPRIQPVGDRPKTPGAVLKPGSSQEFTVDAGGWYDIKAAGKYEMVCVFEQDEYRDARSNAVTFEVLPLKRVDVPPSMLMASIADFERGEPDYPFMFYITRGPGRFDTIVCVSRHGTGGYEHYEPHWLGEIAPEEYPEMATQEAKVALVVPDKRNAAVSWRYVLDFSTRPVGSKGEKVVHEPGMPPPVSFE